jgi:hypothetical protein
MGIGAQRINLAAMLASSRVIALAAVLGTAPVLAELELVPEVAVLEPVAESLAIVLAEALVPAIVPAEVQELETVQVRAVPELETGPGGAELELRTVLVAEPVLEVVQAEEPVPNQPHGHLAVPEKTKSVTALHRHDLAAVLMAEDLPVAEAETMHGQAAAEAVTAWAAAE